MLRRLLTAAVLAAGLTSPVFAQQNQWQGVTLYDLRGQPLGTSTNPLTVTGGGGGSGGSTGTVGGAGTNGSVAQSIQGIVGGVPVNGFVGQYNSTLPTFSSAQVGYLALDSNGRLILSPTTVVSVNGTYNTTQPTLTNGQTAGLQLDASGNLRVVDNSAVIADQGAVTTASPTYTNGTNASLSLTTAGALRTDASSTTQPVSAASLPLPTGAATSANQSSEITALGTTSDSAYAGSGTASIIAGLKGVYNATLAPLATGTNTIGSIANISGTVSLPTGAATAANQSSEISSLATIALRAQVYAEANGAAAGASATLLGGTRDAGTSIPWTNFNAIINSNQNGTLVVQGSNDNFTTGVIISSNAITANTSTTITVPVLFRYNRAYLTNGTTAATYSLNTSYTAN